MQDYYHISDNEENWEYPNEDRYIESLTLESFQECSELMNVAKHKGIELTYFSDIRIDSNSVNALLNMLISIDQSEFSEFKIDSYNKINNILKKASMNGAGIIAYAD